MEDCVWDFYEYMQYNFIFNSPCIKNALCDYSFNKLAK
jgi:hypothetical protein